MRAGWAAGGHSLPCLSPFFILTSRLLSLFLMNHESWVGGWRPFLAPPALFSFGHIPATLPFLLMNHRVGVTWPFLVRYISPPHLCILPISHFNFRPRYFRNLKSHFHHVGIVACVQVTVPTSHFEIDMLYTADFEGECLSGHTEFEIDACREIYTNLSKIYDVNFDRYKIVPL